jgi:hypothetical protein
MLDADEVPTAGLCGEIARLVQGAPADLAMALVRRRDWFDGRWLRRASGYPTWFPRLFRPHLVRVERAVNEHYVGAGASVRLQGHLLHYPFAKGLGAWIDKHNRYASMEAALLARAGPAPRSRDLLAADPLRRRSAHKRLLYRLPLRPLWAFLGLYLLRGGLVDGAAGLRFCLLRAWYELLIDLKRREARAQGAAALLQTGPHRP